MLFSNVIRNLSLKYLYGGGVWLYFGWKVAQWHFPSCLRHFLLPLHGICLCALCIVLLRAFGKSVARLSDGGGGKSSDSIEKELCLKRTCKILPCPLTDHHPRNNTFNTISMPYQETLPHSWTAVPVGGEKTEPGTFSYPFALATFSNSVSIAGAWYSRLRYAAISARTKGCQGQSHWQSVLQQLACFVVLPAIVF